MQLKTSNIGTEPVTLSELKTYLKVDYDDEDTLIASLISGVRERVEQFTGLSLVAKTIELFDDEVPDDFYQLPYPEHDAILEVKVNGTVSEYYSTGLTSKQIKPITTTSYNTTAEDEKGFYVKYTTLGTCPEGVKLEIMKAIEEKYRNRGNTFEGSIAELSENSYANLLIYCKQ
jgi:hypothetical protein